MKAPTVILAFAVCCSCMLVSQAFLFNDNMLMWMMMMNPAFSQSMGGGMGGGMPLMLMASGSDKMKTMGTGLLLSRMFGGGGQTGGAMTGGARTGTGGQM